MYSYEDRLKAVELFIKYDYSPAAVIHELGYPKSRTSLYGRYSEFRKDGNIRKKSAPPLVARETPLHKISFTICTIWPEVPEGNHQLYFYKIQNIVKLYKKNTKYRELNKAFYRIADS